MTVPGQPGQTDPAAFSDVVRTISPVLRLVASQPLPGGVSAKVTAIDAETPTGRRERFVLRQYGAANLRADPHIATHEYQLLALLHDTGLLVPRPCHADESRLVLPVPWLVVEYIDGEVITDPAKLTGPSSDFTGQLASVLARVHKAGFTRADAPYLADVRTVAMHKMGTWPAAPDQALNEAAIRAALARRWPPPQLNRPILVHGDYWPGNTLWQHNALVCILDWEDAMLGDPLVDVSNVRMELCMAFGGAAAAEFTSQYFALMPDVAATTLPTWDLYAALRHTGRMGEWGLAPADLARLQAGHRQFTAQVLAELGR